MLAARSVCLRTLPCQSLRPAFSRAFPTLRNSSIKANQWTLQPYQGYASKARMGVRRGRTGQEIKEAAFEPAMETAFKVDQMGRWIVAGGAAVGLGALCYYGMGMSNEIGAIEKAVIWPQYVKDRIRSTYMYFAGSVGLTALSAVAVSRSPALMSLMMRGSWLAIGATFAAMIGAGMLVRSISYEGNPGAKHLAWMLHAAPSVRLLMNILQKAFLTLAGVYGEPQEKYSSKEQMCSCFLLRLLYPVSLSLTAFDFIVRVANTGVMGAVVAPLTLLGGPLLIRAAWYTAGIVGGLSTVAMCAPSEKFLNMGGPLGVGLGLVLASSVGSMFLPPTSAFGAGLYSVAVYGGLILFGMFLLYDTQKVIKRAETHPVSVYGVAKYDPINSCMGIYMDTLNIFIRVATMLATGGSNRRK